MRTLFLRVDIAEPSAGDAAYEFTLIDGSGDVPQRFQSVLSIEGLTDYLRIIDAEMRCILDSEWIDREEHKVYVRGLGTQLFQELFPSAMHRFLRDNLDRFDAIVVVTDEVRIPWEMIRVGDPRSKGGTYLAEKGLVRLPSYCGPSWSTARSRIRVRPGRVYHVMPTYADPSDFLSAAQAEERYLLTRLKSKPVAADAEALSKLLTKPGAFDLLHFAGHGMADEGLFETLALVLNKESNSLYTSEQCFLDFVEPGGNWPMVVLNACHLGRPGFSTKFVQSGASVFVGPSWQVDDEAAFTFISTLYERLLRGEELAHAVSEARRVTRRHSDWTWLSYVVYGLPECRLDATL